MNAPLTGSINAELFMHFHNSDLYGRVERIKILYWNKTLRGGDTANMWNENVLE